MDITVIDRSATTLFTPLHRARPVAKLIAFALVLTAVIVSWNSLVLTATLLVLAAVVVATGLDVRLALGLAAYPALFAAVFAFASAPSVAIAVTIVLKAMAAALAAVLLTLTTPYPLLFSTVQRFTPALVGDALLMTYRAIFLLANRFAEMLRIIRLRSPRRPGLAVRARSFSSALGNLLLYSLDLAQRDYDIMRVRGYSGRLRARPHAVYDVRAEAGLIAAATLLAATGLVWRLGWERLNPYSWLPFAAAVAVLGMAVLWRNR